MAFRIYRVMAGLVPAIHVFRAWFEIRPGIARA
jgi:hypothetical protein